MDKPPVIYPGDRYLDRSFFAPASGAAALHALVHVSPSMCARISLRCIHRGGILESQGIWMLSFIR